MHEKLIFFKNNEIKTYVSYLYFKIIVHVNNWVHTNADNFTSTAINIYK